MVMVRAAIVATVLSVITLAGSTPAAAQCVANTPTVTTDREAYPATDAATIQGCGFAFQEPLSILITGPDGRPRSADPAGTPGPYAIASSDTGTFSLVYQFPPTQPSYPGDFGTYTAVVKAPSGLTLASATFTRTPDTYATCSTLPGGGTACWGGSTSQPEFLWRKPTIPFDAPATAPFDDQALPDLAVNVCRLDSAGACIGAPVAQLTSSTRPRIVADPAHESYYTEWAADTATALGRYRVSVTRGSLALGSIVVQVVANKADAAAVDPLLAVGLARGTFLPLRFRLQQPTVRTHVRVNEVESNGGVPGDWIELYNTASIPLSLDGYVVKDNDDTHVAVLPAGATIPAYGFYAVEESLLGFGLGAGDSARLFLPDGSTLVDAYTWSAHALTTYGRCPNGTGAFQVNTSVTRGGANDCRITLRINEVESDGGAPGDWVELYNPGPGPASLRGGLLVTGNNREVAALPAVVVPAGGFFTLDAGLFGFTLEADDAVQVVLGDGTVADAFAWTGHAATTFGRCPSGSGDFIATLGATRDAVNNCFVPVTTLRINEVESNGGTPGDWFELVNTGATTLDLSGWRVLDNDDSRAPYVLPAGTTIAPGGYLVVDESAFGFGLGASDSVRLFDPTGVLYEGYAWTAHAQTTYGRCPDGTGAFRVTTASTRGSANDCSLVIRINEVESSGGTPGDWVELFNAGSAAADIGGFIVRDNDDTHTYVIPAGTIVGAGQYYVVEEAALGFGLGAADSARLFDPAGVLVDSYTWTAHAAITYGRCPNGSGAFAPTTAVSKAAANICTSPVTTLHINEVESNGGTPGDWFELVNTGSAPIDISGWWMLDNDDTHAPYVFPAGTTLGAGAFRAFDEAAFGFGLGAADSVRIFDASGALYESHAWTAHASTTYGRCPDGTGAFTTSTAVTKGAANACGSPVRINEIESSGGVPGDWIELHNPSTSAADLSGLVVRDNDDTHTYTIPAGTTLAAGGYYVVDEAALGFGLGAADSARLFDGAGTLLDAYTWTAHATVTYGRCPDGSGAFGDTAASTREAVNRCPGDPNPWPGGPTIQTADGAGVLGGNMSGLVYEAGAAGTGVLWAAKNGPGTLYRLLFTGTEWAPDSTGGWASGKALLYPDGTGNPDAEGVTFADAGPVGGMFVATERNNSASGVSRNSILRFDVNGTDATLTATHEWNLTADLPAVGPNVGLEAITWIPDAFLVAQGFVDDTGAVYDPANYPNHGTGLFFVGIEANGLIVGYALDDTGGFRRVATITSGFAGVMDLHFDRETNDLWAVCDDTCNGRSAILRIDPATHRFAVAAAFDRPSSMPNLNNEGFGVAPLGECASGQRPVFWADDSATGGHAVRSGTMSCAPLP